MRGYLFLLIAGVLFLICGCMPPKPYPPHVRISVPELTVYVCSYSRVKSLLIDGEDTGQTGHMHITMVPGKGASKLDKAEVPPPHEGHTAIPPGKEVTIVLENDTIIEIGENVTIQGLKMPRDAGTIFVTEDGCIRLLCGGPMTFE